MKRAKKVDIMHVYGRAQLAAAIAAVAHDAPVTVVLHLSSGKDVAYNFDYTAPVVDKDIFGRKRERAVIAATMGSERRRQRTKELIWHHIDDRLSRIAYRVRRTPKEAFA